MAVNQLVAGSIPAIGAIRPVGEAVNTHGFHPWIHGFDSRTGHQNKGRLAQLGEQRPYKAKVRGSSPLSSTISPL
ncbi:hypothetical protein MHP7448_0690 [Mesomycoplasma hyopneumoniae 7448]|uniref:Uncharacterized protein n=1 Tax=Mesomycoplasma hyopneumoniae (strain 7448) TaxID=262722 RepID=A4Q7V7_MESH7|nr:hypothetical protein MHP7448_0690 [Mesomycoplasma hyopneumoniae 7448]